MSEQRKRLTHNEVAQRWESLKLGRADLADHEDALEADHLQAREDRKRLAATLRDMAPFRWRGTGTYCWCPEARGSACFNRKGEATGRGCVAKNALLAEVDPQ